MLNKSLLETGERYINGKVSVSMLNGKFGRDFPRYINGKC